MSLSRSIRLTSLASSFVASCLWVFCPGILPAQEAASDESPTRWVSVQGTAIEAVFVRMAEDKVVLEMSKTGKEVTVSLSSLSLESHLQALKLANPQAYNKPLVKADVAPPPEPFVPEITLSGDELLESPFVSDSSLENFLETLNTELERGNTFVAWHALPPRMQTDVEKILGKVLGSVKPQQMIQLRTLFKSIRTVIVDKQEFIFGHPAFASQPGSAAQLRQEWPMFQSLAEAVCAEENWQIENFGATKVVPWVANMSARIGPFVHAGMKDVKQVQGQVVNYNITSQSSDGGEVELSLAGAPGPLKVRVQKFEKIWIVPEWMSAMRGGVDQALPQVADGIDTSALSIGLLGVNAIAGKIARASTQEEFNEAIAELETLPGVKEVSEAVRNQVAMQAAGQGMAPPAAGQGMSPPGVGKGMAPPAGGGGGERPGFNAAPTGGLPGGKGKGVTAPGGTAGSAE